MTVSVLNGEEREREKRRRREQYIPTEEKLDDTSAEIETSPRKVFMPVGCSK
jgi:hypothetical protein